MRQYSSSLYQAERLAWTAPAYLLNQVAPPLAANYILKASYFAATVVFLFGALRQICGLRTAAFVSALASLYSFVAHSLGANYVDGAANTYFLIAVYAANRAALGEGSGMRSAFTAGVACVAILLTHFSLVLVLPLFAGYALLMRAQVEQRKTIAYSVGVVSFFLIGAATAWMAAAAAYMYWGIPVRPLQQSLDFVSGANPNSFAMPDSAAWILLSYWLLLPLTVVGWILPRVAAACGAGWRAALRVPPAYWLLLSVCGLWTAMTVMYFLNVPWMMLPFYASYLIPATFLALGPALRPIVERLSARSYWRLLGLLFFGAFAGYRLNDPRFAAEAALAAAVCLLLATLLRAANRINEDRRAVAVLTLLCWHLSPLTSQQRTIPFKLETDAGTGDGADLSCAGTGVPMAQSRPEAFKGPSTLPRSFCLSGKHYYFWYNGDDALGMFFRSVTSMFYAWSTRDLLDERFQGIRDETINSLLPQPGNRVRDLLVLTRSADVRVEGSPLHLQWTERLSAAGTPFYAHYFVVDMVRAAGFEATPRRIELASRFPCDLETRAAALWFDHPLNTARTSADSQGLRDLFEAGTQSPIQCLSAYARLTERLGAAEQRSRYVPAAASCEPELTIAEAYFSDAFDAALRGQTAGLLATARAAQSEKQIESCRLAVADIRRAYFEVIYGATDSPDADSRLRLASVGIDFEPSPRRLRLARGFPCSVEGAAAARWYDRPSGTGRTPVERQPEAQQVT
jgi:hypothetical protein